LNGDTNGGAWCPSSPVSRDRGTTEWLELDLGGMHVITGALTQGRFGNGRGVEFAEAYKIHYWRPGMTDFIEYHDSLGRTVRIAENEVEPKNPGAR
jgi:discoidin domain receptor family protein 2